MASDRRPIVLLAACGLAASTAFAQNDPLTRPFPAVFELADLDASLGFRLDGVEGSDYCGRAVASAGDVNGDGIDDMLIGAAGRYPGGLWLVGSAYVVFGRDAASGGSFPSDFDLATLDGVYGFRLNGVGGGDYTGWSVASAGDVNGDGIDDILVGARGVDDGASSYLNQGASFVVFGRDVASSGFPASVDLSSLDGTTGFRLDGVDVGDYSGSVSSAGDLNGDGIDDVIIGAFGADPTGVDRAGSSYVVFGRNVASGGFPASFDLSSLDGNTGFRLDGVDVGDFSGCSVASAGDLNGDGVGDIVVAARGSDPDGRYLAGSIYVVFGRDASAGDVFPRELRLADLDGVIGFRMDGTAIYDRIGTSVSSAGDINGDGIDDIIIGAGLADVGGSTVRAPASLCLVAAQRPVAFPPQCSWLTWTEQAVSA